MERLGSLKIGVSPCSNLPDSLSYSSRSAGSNPRNDSLNGTNRDTEDEGYSLLQLPDSLSYDWLPHSLHSGGSNPRTSSGLDGTNWDTKNEG